MKSKTFTGAGINRSSLLIALKAASEARSPLDPIGATWPLVRIVVDDEQVEFVMPQVQKIVRKKDTRIEVSKAGYVYFRTLNQVDDFGFCTPRIGRLLSELKKRGYKLGKSCRGNLLFARISLALLVAFPVMILSLLVFAFFKG